MCLFEFTATPVTSPKYRSGGRCKKSGTDRYGISGTGDCCAQSEQGAISKTRRSRFSMADLHSQVNCAELLSSCKEYFKNSRRVSGETLLEFSIWSPGLSAILKLDLAL